MICLMLKYSNYTVNILMKMIIFNPNVPFNQKLKNLNKTKVIHLQIKNNTIKMIMIYSTL